MISLWGKILAQLPFWLLRMGHEGLPRKHGGDVQERQWHFPHRASSVEQRVDRNWEYLRLELADITKESSTESERHKITNPARSKWAEGGEILLGEVEDHGH